jgi:hypothetical protein
VVALLNAGYEGSVNCLKELQWAVDKDKPILACLADPSPEWMPSEHVAGLVGMRSHLLVDLRAAAALDVDAESPEWSLLTRQETALPLMLRFMKERLGVRAEAEAAPPAPPAPPAIFVPSALVRTLSGPHLVRQTTKGSDGVWNIAMSGPDQAITPGVPLLYWREEALDGWGGGMNEVFELLPQPGGWHYVVGLGGQVLDATDEIEPGFYPRDDGRASQRWYLEPSGHTNATYYVFNRHGVLVQHPEKVPFNTLISHKSITWREKAAPWTFRAFRATQ